MSNLAPATPPAGLVPAGGVVVDLDAVVRAAVADALAPVLADLDQIKAGQTNTAIVLMTTSAKLDPLAVLGRRLNAVLDRLRFWRR